MEVFNMSEDILVKVRRQPNDGNIATYRRSDIFELYWDDVSGGIQQSFMGQHFLYGYVWCNAAVEGAVAHSGPHGIKNHGKCPHYIKVCVLKSDNSETIYKSLTKGLPPKPQLERSKPKSGNTCKVDIIATLSERGAMRETRLTTILENIGHGTNNIKFVLKKLAKDKILAREKDPKDRRFNMYRIIDK